MYVIHGINMSVFSTHTLFPSREESIIVNFTIYTIVIYVMRYTIV